MPLLGAGLIVRDLLHYVCHYRIIIDRSNPKLFSSFLFPHHGGINAATEITKHNYITFTHDSTLNITAPNSAADANADTSDTGIICPPISMRQIAFKQVVGNKRILHFDEFNQRSPVNQQLYRGSTMFLYGAKAKCIHNGSL